MAFLRTIRCRHFYSLLSLQNLKNPLYSDSRLSNDLLLSNLHSLSSLSKRTLSLSAQFELKIETDSIDVEERSKEKAKSKKPLDVLFKEAVGLAEHVESEEEEEEQSDSEKAELKKKLKKLENEVMVLKESRKDEEEIKIPKRKPKIIVKKPHSDDDVEGGVAVVETNSKATSLHAMFAHNAATKKNKKLDEPAVGTRMEDHRVYKELSPDMILFVTHLYKEGYFKDANFLPRNKFDVTCFENAYGRDFTKFAAEKFGQNNQEIAKWLSGSDLRKIALFGCPSLSRKTVFSAKRLRTFFRIQEDTVCSKCAMKESCKFVNQSVWKGDTKNLNLAVVMRVIVLYALESVHPKLVVCDDVKASVSRLLKEVLNLSQTVS